jgi:glycosyltransferase involved in cell wall biosynthesis
MKILALAADKGGCGFYRVREPARVARDLGVVIEVSDGVDVEAEQDTKTGLTKVTEVKTDADLIIIQRPLDNAYTALIEQANRQGIATIVELDDDFEMTHTKNAAHHDINTYEHTNVKWLKAACAAADHVTVSTPALEKYGKGKATVLRNAVPQSIFEWTPVHDLNREPLTVGWTGTTQVHPFDLQETRGALGDFLKDNQLSFSVVGDGTDVQRFLGLSSETPFSATGWVSLENYYETMRNTLDIGIVPLEMSPFNHAKSALKGMEMAALGIPFIASPTKEYERFELYGVGKTASSAKEWVKHLQKWIDKPLTRESDARKYREIVYNENTIEDNASKWVETWERTITQKRAQL